MHVPGWHETTKAWQADGDVQMLGIVQEQHPNRARLFMQWKQMDWPVLVDSLNLLEVDVVPLTLAIDEHGIIQQIHPPLDRPDELRRTFVDAAFKPPDGQTSDFPRPPLKNRTAERPMGSNSPNLRRAHDLYRWENDTKIDAIVAAFERAAAVDPEHGYGLFRTGVAFRRRYDSSSARPGDFQRAVHFWEAALNVDPNNYIWRRRIQQYGPRLDKPYPFYDWVPVARADISARGEVPASLLVEPGGAEYAQPAPSFAADSTSPPEIDDRILRDDGTYIVAESTLVPGTVAPGASTRAHLTFLPNAAIKAHWNNEVDDLVFWIQPPDGWDADHRVVRVANPPQTVSLEPRKIELEVRAPQDAADGEVTLPGYALYYVCEDVNGICLYRRQDVTLTLRIQS